ncbi:HNH endonuclease [Pseudomonas laurylsulfativorans]|jgi:5-methylcytosine-specific restriction protein A|uniref:HNH endonuclease n=1 Tax=Pseudomonas laurylsulfativorans TaxID=1943631 RepID=UPI00345F545D
MPRLKTLQPRMMQAEGRPFAIPIAPESADGWGSGRGGRPWRRKRAAILLRDEYTCQACGVITSQLEVDHIINRARGGSDDDENLQALCIPCHKLKTAAESAEGAGRL